jgi:NADPH oxidase 2
MSSSLFTTLADVRFHKVVAWSIVFFTLVHTAAHLNNLAQLSIKNSQGFVGFLKAGFLTGPTWTGWIMLLALMAIVFTSIESRRRAQYERFWYTHHLFVVFFVFWSLHGVWCMIPTDMPPYCSGTGVFYLYWVYGGVIYLTERIAREIRGRHKTFISKVIQHPSNVVEVQIKKEKTKSKAGQVRKNPPLSGKE